MSIIAVKYIWQNARNLSDRALLAGLAIADHHNEQTGQCNPSIKKLIAKTGRSKSTILRGIKELEDATEIVIGRRENCSNRYNFPGCKTWSGGVNGDTTPSIKVDTTLVSTVTPESEIEPEERTGKRNPSGARGPQAAPCLMENPDPQRVGSRENRETELLQNFSVKRCREDHKTRLRFYLECGRLHTDADHFHKPKDPKNPISFGQGDALRGWFVHLPTSGCEVMNFAIKNWPELRKKWQASHDPEFERIQARPTISGLEKFDYQWLFKLWQKSAQKAALNRVAANIATEQAA